MMKVKPFSYHIPPRRKSHSATTNISVAATRIDFHSRRGDSRTSNKTNNRRKRSDRIREENLSTPPRNYLTVLSNLCCGNEGLTVLIPILLVGFIGVAGQGKVTEMDGSRSAGRFPPQSHLSSYPSLPHRSFTTLSDLADGFANESDEALQQRITSMGHYGIRYRNDSYNYSSHLSPYYYRSRQQYKLDPGVGTLLPTSPHESLSLTMSLHPDQVNDHVVRNQRVSSQNSSGKLDENMNNLQPSSPLMLPKNNYVGRDKLKKDHYPTGLSITKWAVPNQTSSDAHNRQVFSAKSVPDIHSYNQVDSDGDDEDVNNLYNRNKTKGRNRLPLAGEDDSGSDADDEGEEEVSEDDAYVMERFTPANSSHTSGRLRFRQGSQAEVDDADFGGDGDSGATGTKSSRRRPRRSVVHLYDMVVCSTGCNPLIFKGYGCYCGFLGSGLTVDGIDKCCAKHDFCYHHAKCPPLLTYFVPYYWRCDHGRPECVTDFRGWKGICGAHLCECDRQFAECLKKFPCPRSRAMCLSSPFRFWQNLLMTPSMRYRRY